MSAASCQSCAPDVDRARIAAKVKDASSSFYWAMRILAKPQREAIFAVYAFCRAVDDIADGPIQQDVKRKALDRWRSEIAALYEGMPTFEIVKALKAPVEQFGLRREDFEAVIDGMQTDADGPVIAPSQAELDVYCDQVACAVGRLCVHIFGEPGPNGYAVAKHQGMALQLTNILRDVAEDADDGRLYLPAELLDRFNIESRNPAEVQSDPNYPALWRHMAEMADVEYTQMDTALAKCDPSKMRASLIMANIYRLNLKRMRQLDDKAIADPAVSKRLVGKLEKVYIALASLWS